MQIAWIQRKNLVIIICLVINLFNIDLSFTSRGSSYVYR